MSLKVLVGIVLTQNGQRATAQTVIGERIVNMMVHIADFRGLTVDWQNVRD